MNPNISDTTSMISDIMTERSEKGEDPNEVISETISMSENLMQDVDTLSKQIRLQ